ncbi:hypothetical protein T492DRAFT_993086 [Pavlovales sp. CCMP2436]|nr:hypothetical protein T492DRAFT_993086 [Pavlovales sp. CCMP2436]
MRAEQLEVAGLVNFVSGLLEVDPDMRWTPVQAAAHLFVRDEPEARRLVAEAEREGGRGAEVCPMAEAEAGIAEREAGREAEVGRAGAEAGPSRTASLASAGAVPAALVHASDSAAASAAVAAASSSLAAVQRLVAQAADLALGSQTSQPPMPSSDGSSLMMTGSSPPRPPSPPRPTSPAPGEPKPAAAEVDLQHTDGRTGQHEQLAQQLAQQLAPLRPASMDLAAFGSARQPVSPARAQQPAQPRPRHCALALLIEAADGKEARLPPAAGPGAYLTGLGAETDASLECTPELDKCVPVGDGNGGGKMPLHSDRPPHALSDRRQLVN